MAYWDGFREFQPRLQRLVATVEAGRIPLEEMKVLAIDMQKRNIYLEFISNFEGSGTAEEKAQRVRAWKDYEPAVKDLYRLINRVRELDRSNVGADSPLEAGSAWLGEGRRGPRTILLIFERAGERFRARYATAEEPGRFVTVRGTINGHKIVWLAKNAGKNVNSSGPDSYGTVNGEVLTIGQSGSGVTGSGSYVLRLKKY